jgi:lipid-binding SYLF domain-containing protein
MPLNAKGRKIKAAMIHEYGVKKGESVFYASENKGIIKGITVKGQSISRAKRGKLKSKGRF